MNVIAREQRDRGNPVNAFLDCFVTLFLAMTLLAPAFAQVDVFVPPKTTLKYKEYEITPETFQENWNKHYVGMSYGKALKSERPLVLLFVDPRDIFSAFRFAPLGELLVSEFNHKYNITVMNMKYGLKDLPQKTAPEFVFTKKLAEAFGVEQLPALVLVNTRERTYHAVPLEDCTREKLPQIMREFWNKHTSF